jgi:hypothetical protein
VIRRLRKHVTVTSFCHVFSRCHVFSCCHVFC